VRVVLLGNLRILRVLVDNKSTAKIGKRCLSLEGWWRFGIAGTTRDSKRWQPITVTGGWLQIVKGCSGCSKTLRTVECQATTSG
jgi:hypothetical protein